MEASEKRQISVNSVLKLLGVSPSGYYSWKKRKPSNRSFRKKLLLLKFIMNRDKYTVNLKLLQYLSLQVMGYLKKQLVIT